MKQKYYGFDGTRLVYIGEFENYGSAKSAYYLSAEWVFVHIDSLDKWKEIIPKMLESIQKEFL